MLHNEEFKAFLKVTSPNGKVGYNGLAKKALKNATNIGHQNRTSKLANLIIAFEDLLEELSLNIGLPDNQVIEFKYMDEAIDTCVSSGRQEVAKIAHGVNQFIGQSKMERINTLRNKNEETGKWKLVPFSYFFKPSVQEYFEDAERHYLKKLII